MDSFFGIGLAELVVILLLAGLLMGPQRIREVARVLGRVTAQLQSISREFTRQLNAELDSLDTGEVRGAMADVRDLRRQVEDLKRELSAVPGALARESQSALSRSDGDDNAAAGQPDLPRPLDVADDPET